MSKEPQKFKDLQKPIINYVELVGALHANHTAYMKKYQIYVEKHMNEQIVERQTVHARLKLVCKAFVDAGVIQEVKDVDIIGYMNSLALVVSPDIVPLYILNDRNNIIIASGGASEDALSSRITIVTTGRGVFEKVEDVLSPAFDWTQFSMRLLEVLHSTIYPKEEAMRDFLARFLKLPQET